MRFFFLIFCFFHFKFLLFDLSTFKRQSFFRVLINYFCVVLCMTLSLTAERTLKKEIVNHKNSDEDKEKKNKKIRKR